MFGDKIKNTALSRDDDTFTFTNPGVGAVNFGLFASSWVYTAYPSISIVDGGVVQNPEEFLDYQELVNDKEMSPKKIKGIRVIVQNQSDLNNTLFWNSQDANGQMKSFADYPIHFLSPMQFQGRLVDIYYKDLILGLDQYLVYRIEGGSSVTMTLIYDDLNLDCLLKSREARAVNYNGEDAKLLKTLLQR